MKTSQEEVNELKEKLNLLETVIQEIKKLDLYENTVDYDWDENPYPVYLLFDVDEFIEDIKYQKRLTK